MIAFHVMAVALGAVSIGCALIVRHPGRGWGITIGLAMVVAMLDGLTTAVVPALAWAVVLVVLAVAASAAGRRAGRHGLSAARIPVSALVMALLVTLAGHPALAAAAAAAAAADGDHTHTGGAMTVMVVAAVVAQCGLCAAEVAPRRPRATRVRLAAAESVAMAASALVMAVGLLAA